MITPQTKKEILSSLRKAEGMLRKIEEMIERGEYCIDIMQQNLAVIGILKRAHKKIMKDHLKSCFREGLESKNKRKQQKMIEEIIKVSELYNK